MKTGNIRVIDRAEVPKFPVKPRKKLNIILASIMGLILGVGTAFFLEYLDNTIKFPDDILTEFYVSVRLMKGEINLSKLFLATPSPIK